MSSRRKAVERVKTGLIVLLTFSALLLAWRTNLFNDVLAAVPLLGNVGAQMRDASGTAESGSTSFKEAARPLGIVITLDRGGRFGVKYDTDTRNAVYRITSGIIGEALGSASSPNEISEYEWRLALSKPGVYYEYIAPVRLSVLYGWLLGARMPEYTQDFMLRRVFITFGEDRNRLYYQDHDSGLFFGSDTGSAAGKSQELEMYGENGAEFAFETGVLGSENAPYMLIMRGSDHPDVRSAVSAGSSEDLLGITLAAFGHLNETYTTYPGGADTLICVGTQFNIGVFSDGRVQYRRTDGLPSEDEALEISESEMIERARAIVADSIGATSGSAEIHFEALERSGSSYSVFFGYYIAGGGVYLQEDRHGALVVFNNGMVTDIEVHFRHFSFTGEHTRLWPERQVLAAAGGEFMLCYSDSGAEILQPFWVKPS